MKKYILLLSVIFLLFLSSCQQPGGNSTGSEYMPDMGHSIAYEANYYNYYYNNTWGSEDLYYKMAQPRLPVEGTVPRGYSATHRADAHPSAISYPASGNMPYYYDNTEEERTRAIAELVDNPFTITDSGLAQGKELYNLYCGICHGEKADGNGYLARDGGAYPVQPAILTTDEFIEASNGRYYHSIMYGKNLMGSYADKLSYEERWQVIHYIRSLQAVEKKLEYNQYNNTLNSIDRPAGVTEMVSKEDEAHGEHHGDEEGHGNGHNDHDESH